VGIVAHRPSLDRVPNPKHPPTAATCSDDMGVCLQRTEAWGLVAERGLGRLLDRCLSACMTTSPTSSWTSPPLAPTPPRPSPPAAGHSATAPRSPTPSGTTPGCLSRTTAAAPRTSRSGSPRACSRSGRPGPRGRSWASFPGRRGHHRLLLGADQGGHEQAQPMPPNRLEQGDEQPGEVGALHHRAEEAPGGQQKWRRARREMDPPRCISLLSSVLDHGKPQQA